jgi:putative ATPase subunit gpP of terminase
MGSTIEMLTKQKEVKALYMDGNRTAREISKMANVSENTISDWVNKFKWKEARDFRLKRETLIGELENLDADYVLNGFADFLASKYPYLKAQMGFFIDEFKRALNEQ